MASANIVAFKTPVVREMTREEYFEQRRRVVESLMREQPDSGGSEPDALRMLKSTA